MCPIAFKDPGVIAHLCVLAHYMQMHVQCGMTSPKCVRNQVHFSLVWRNGTAPLSADTGLPTAPSGSLRNCTHGQSAGSVQNFIQKYVMLC